MTTSRKGSSSSRKRKMPLGPRIFAILALLMIIALALSAILPLVTR